MKQNPVDPKSARVFQISQDQARPKAGPVMVSKPSGDGSARSAREICIGDASEPPHGGEVWMRPGNDLIKATAESRVATQEFQHQGSASPASQECNRETPPARGAGNDPIRSGAVSTAP